MNTIKVIKGDIFNLRQQVDVVIVRDKKTPNLSYMKSIYPNSVYCIKLPDQELNSENVLEYLDYYKAAIKKAREFRHHSIAIQAIDLFDEGYNISLAEELKDLLEKALVLAYIDVFIVCDNKNLKAAYDYGFYGEVKDITIEIADELNPNGAIIIPTKKKAMKWDKSYKKIVRSERRSVFSKFKFPFPQSLEMGRCYITNGVVNCNCYLLVNLLKEKRMREDKYTRKALDGIMSAMSFANSINCKNVTVPVINFLGSKRVEDNKNIICEIMKMVCDFADDNEINLVFYCPVEDLRNIVCEYFENEGGNL